jgi:CRISPR/Cas system CMR-associated protein Cmr1 (group 7 of RAMP superfamily)
VSPEAAGMRQYQQKVQNVLVSDWLDQGMKLKGAQSDKEGEALKARQPKPTDDYETIIKPWLEDVAKWMQKAKEVAQQKVDSERKVGGGTNGIPKSSVPGLSSKASSYFD